MSCPAQHQPRERDQGGSPLRAGALGLVALLLVGAGCSPVGAPEASQSATEATPAARGAAAGGTAEFTIPPPDDWDRLLRAHHLRWILGDLPQARALLQDVLQSAQARSGPRALAAMRLAEMAELAGERREALGYLEQVKSLSGAGSVLALEASDRRARILSAAPLADVRGPVPGSVSFKGEDPAGAAAFRQAEGRLAGYHRIVVEPQMENINEVLLTKRRAMAAAISLYQQAAKAGGPALQAASHFRIGAMYHHLAEALAFEAPPELLPSEARRLKRALRTEGTGYLRRALAAYRAAAKIELPPTSTWQKLAQREAETLAVVLKAPGKR